MRIDKDCPKWKAPLYFQIQALNMAGKIDGREAMIMNSLVDSSTDQSMELVEIPGGFILRTSGKINND